jgi:tetratricopeptide (TPR) repeat protein
MSHILRALVLAVAIHGVAWGQGHDDPQDAVRCVQESNADLALDYCSRAIQSQHAHPKVLAVLLTARGTRYADRGEYDRAMQDFDHAIRLDPDFALAFNNRGHVYTGKSDYDRAIQDFDQAIRLDADFALAFTNRGNAYSAKGEYDRALQDYSHAIRLKPGDVLPLYNRGNVFVLKGEYDQAIQDYDAAIRLQADDVDAIHNRGEAYRRKGAHDRAIQDFDQAIRLRPDLAPAFSNRGHAYVGKGEYDRAIQDFDVAIRLRPNDELMARSRAMTLALQEGVQAMAKDRFQDAITHLQRAIEANPDAREPYTAIRTAYGLRGRSLAEAADSGLLLLARQHLDRGDFVEAERVLKRLLQAHFANPATHFWLGELHTRRGSFSDAERARKMFRGLLHAVLAPRRGDSLETAILVQSISEEYLIIGLVLGCRFLEQRLSFPPSGGVYDVMKVKCGDAVRTLYFDVTAWGPEPTWRVKSYRPVQ